MNWADCSVCGRTRQVRSDGLVHLHHFNRVPCAGSYLKPAKPAGHLRIDTDPLAASDKTPD